MRPAPVERINHMPGEIDSNGVSAKPRPEGIRVVERGERFASPIPCPECGGSTVIAIDNCESGTGEPKVDGFRLICIRDERRSESKGYRYGLFGDRHFYWQSLWVSSLRDALKWMKAEGIRVFERGKYE
jgi:hypothetical protein